MIDKRLATVVVVGVDLIGTSIGLALSEHGVRVLLADPNHQALDTAVRRGAGEPLDEGAPAADLLVIAVSPSATPRALRSAQAGRMAEAYTDVSSVMAAPVLGARELGCDLTGFVPGHPLCGWEPTEKGQARADLFQGRGWVLCPEESTRPAAVALVRQLVEMCGANPVLMEADAHDRLVALISHTPHLIASAMATLLVDAPEEALRLTSDGVRELASAAGRDPVLWTEILSMNARWVASALSGIAADLVDVCAALQLAGAGDHSFTDDVADLLDGGQAGWRRLTSTAQAEQD